MSNQVVLITGALTGIGRADAIIFAQEGAHIVVSGRRDKEGQALVAELQGIGAEAIFVRTDEPPLRWFWERFQFSEEMREREGLPEITRDVKRRILGLNYLRMHGLDAEALAKNIEGDEFAVARSRGKAEPYSTTSSKGHAK
jgi:hypothetical protein